jgi:parallel beta-helix repeat protein
MSIHTLELHEALPGDRIILCHEGGLYRSALYLESGSALSPIVYDGRGTAVVAASDLIVNWEYLGDGIYSAVVDVQPQQVFFDGAFGNRKENLEELSEDCDWYWTPDVLYVFSATGDPNTVFTAPGIEAGARNVGIGLDGLEHVTIEGLTVRHANISGFRSWNPGDHLTVRNCVAEWNWHLGIDFSGTSPYEAIAIADNIVRYNGTGGIGFFGSGRNSRISGNYCYANGKYQSAEALFEEQHQWTFGIKLWEFQSDQRGNEVIFNECFDNGRESGSLNQGIGVGIWIDGVPGDSQAPNFVRQNLIHDNRGNGVFIEISSNTIVIGNVLFNNATSDDGVNEFTPAGIVIDARVDWVSENNLVLNNTVVGGRCGFKMATYGWSGCSVDNNVIANNIFVGATEHALLAVFGGDNNGLNGSGNVYEFNNLGQETPEFIRWGGDRLDTYETWETAYGQTPWSIEGDPLLAGPSFRSLYLSDASPCRDAGQNLGDEYGECLLEASLWTDALETTAQDLLGDGWDVGAYCFSSGSAPLFYDGFETGDLVRWSSEPIEPIGSSN